VLTVVWSAAAAAGGEEIYREKYALCHDAGVGQAPRIAPKGEGRSCASGAAGDPPVSAE
jgi:hypothetical protein